MYRTNDAFADRTRLIDARRSCGPVIADCIYFINQHRKTISERGRRLATGTLIHSEAYVRQCERRLAERVAQYRKYLRLASELDVELGR
jgi:hypothetical protein